MCMFYRGRKGSQTEGENTQRGIQNSQLFLQKVGPNLKRGCG